MTNWIQIYTILWKQYLQKHRLWIIFLFVAVFAIGIIGRVSGLRQEEYRGIAVGVCWEDEKGKELFRELEEEEGIFRFLGYTDEEEMIRLVENGTLECGYLFPEDFYDQLLEKGAKRQITLYYSPASSAHKISYEVVFAKLFEVLSEDILTEYFGESGYEKERLFSLNRQYAGDGSTFQFVYETVEQKGVEAAENMDTFKGCIGVMMFLMSLLGLGNAMEQEKIWKAMPGHFGRRMKSGSIHVAVLGSILMGGGCLLIMNMQSRQGRLGRELMALGAYFVVLELYVRFLGLFIKRSRVLYGLIPILILGSCLFCPVFIRMENYINGAAWISRLFPVSYYLDI
ncbi:MAG: ABC transporter permease [Lachnospiraceae bacterium]|nr:ABC transporter permease [Lachnospiraceae bacterium]